MAEADDLQSNITSISRPNNWISIREHYRGQPRRIKIVIIGAGFSGLIMAHKIQNQYKLDDIIEHVIYEKNADIGGTWYENRYPGLRCDVPAHSYIFSWEPNPDWSTYYASGPEILAYIKRTADKYNLTKNVHLNSKVICAEWKESDGKWYIQIDQNGKIIEDKCDILVNGSGYLNTWKWPDIDGLKDFQGHLVHSAQWVDGYEFEGKTIGLIGNGSSAIQILPAMQPIAAHITCFIRNPTWISPNFVGQFAGTDGKNFKYTEEQKAELRSDPNKLFELRKKFEHELNNIFALLLKDTQEHAKGTAFIREFMVKRLGGNEELIKQLIPPWKVGCRRLTPGDDYLEALTAENVNMTMSPIRRFTETGIETIDNKHYNLDAIICATGFDVSFRPNWKLIGRNGDDLAEIWDTNPEGYFGVAAHGFPNYFIFNGPNAPVGHGSLLAAMDSTADYILKWARKLQTEDIHSVDVSKEAVDDYNIYAQEFLKRTVWSEDCRSWYKHPKSNGKVTAMYPGSIIHFKEMLEELREEDFTIKYNSANRFAFMGNGFTKRELDGEDLSFYLEK